MTSYEIFWNDLTDEAKERLEAIHSGNDDIPIVIIDIEEEDITNVEFKNTENN